MSCKLVHFLQFNEFIGYRVSVSDVTRQGVPIQLNDESEKSYTKYSYKVFGLHIESEILLPELITAIDPPVMPEVIIRLGKVPADIPNVIQKTNSYQLARDQFLLRLAGVGCYYVTNGNCIVVEPAEEAEESLVRLLLLNATFAPLLIQRGIIPIHGSAVVIDGCGVIFTGVSGCGKSTLLSAFRKRGYYFLTDDVAAVTVDADGVAWVHSAFPQLKLWRDSVQILDIDTASLKPVYFNKDKFSMPAHQGFCQTPVPLAAVYELEAAKCGDVTVKTLAGTDKLAVLLSHTYRLWLVDGLCQNVVHFQQCVAVASRVAVSRLTRPEGVFSLEEQVRLVQQDLARQRDGRAV